MAADAGDAEAEFACFFLDGEASDMDEFELELLGEGWAYVTIALGVFSPSHFCPLNPLSPVVVGRALTPHVPAVGMENCPHHHSHAIELERVARFNPHVGFFDVHGRVLERLVVKELLESVYPVDPPAYEEILRPEYELREELPGYCA